MVKQLTLQPGKTTLDLQLIDAPDGQKYLDLSQLEAAGVRALGWGRETYIPTRISDVDPEGRLTYRDYRIQDLVEKSNYEETSYLLLRGELPNQTELNDFKAALAKDAVLSPKLQKMLVAKLKTTAVDERTDAMALMGELVAAMHTQDEKDAPKDPKAKRGLDVSSEKTRYETAIRTMAVMPTLLGLVNARLQNADNPDALDNYKFPEAADFGKNGENFSYARLLLGGIRQQPMDSLDAKEVRALDQYLMLHAEHGHNLSSFGATIAGSSETKSGGWLFTQAGMANLSGNQHGNASVDALMNLKHIWEHTPGKDAQEKVDNYVADIAARIDDWKAKTDAAKKGGPAFDEPQPVIEGVGHAVYRALDPRASTILGVLKTSGVQTPLLDVAVKLADKLAEHEKFGKKPGRPLAPNTDFFSGVLLTQYLKIDERLMTSMFAVARDVGWHAHVSEHKRNNGKSIIRPNAIYIPNNPEGAKERDFVAMEDRQPPTNVTNAAIMYEHSGKVAIPKAVVGK